MNDRNTLRIVWFIIAVVCLLMLAKNGLLANEPTKPEPPVLLEVE